MTKDRQTKLLNWKAGFWVLITKTFHVICYPRVLSSFTPVLYPSKAFHQSRFSEDHSFCLLIIAIRLDTEINLFTHSLTHSCLCLSFPEMSSPSFCSDDLPTVATRHWWIKINKMETHKIKINSDDLLFIPWASSTISYRKLFWCWRFWIVFFNWICPNFCGTNKNNYWLIEWYLL